MHTLNMFQIRKRNTLILVSFQVVIVTSSATLSSTLFASLFELAASIFALSPVYILEMSVVHKTTMHIPVFSTQDLAAYCTMFERIQQV